MLEYIHELPTGIQRGEVTHAKVGRTIIDDAMLHAKVIYGSTDADGTFVPDDLAGTHKLVVPDMKDFAEAPSSLSSVPSTKGKLLEKSAEGLALYADSNNLWPGLE